MTGDHPLGTPERPCCRCGRAAVGLVWNRALCAWRVMCRPCINRTEET